MSLELINASVERGLRGSSGFATAVATKGLPSGLEPMLEQLSAYDFDASRAIGADRIEWAHRIVTVQGRPFSVLSRTAPCGSDWSGRANRVSHHVVVEASERAPAGPAWTLSAMRTLADSVPQVEERAEGPVVPTSGSPPPRAAHAWTAMGFDAGWAGVVAQALVDSPNAPCYLVLPPECDALPLLNDVLALVPEDRRWLVTFSTRFQRANANTRCQLRCVRAGAPSLAKLFAEPGARKVDASSGASAGDSAAAEAGRIGRIVGSAARAPSRVDPVLRDADAPRGTEEREGDSHERIAAVAHAPQPGSATLVPPELPRDAAPGERGAVPGPWLEEPERPIDESNMLAYILFGIAGAALIASFVLALLMILQR